MRTLHALALLALASCAHPNQPSHPPQSEPIGADAVPRADTVVAQPARPLDSVLVLPHQSLIDKVFGRKRTATRTKTDENGRITIGKKATVSVYYGPATVTTNTVGKKAAAATADGATATTIGKAKGPTAIGDSASAQDFTKQAQRGGAAASGQGATATATTQKKTLAAYLVPALGVAAGFGLLYWLLVGGGGVWLAALWRKNKSNSNQV